MSLVSELPICGPSVSTLCPPAAPPSLVTSPAPALLPTQYLQRGCRRPSRGTTLHSRVPQSTSTIHPSTQLTIFANQTIRL